MSGIMWVCDRPKNPGFYWYADRSTDLPILMNVHAHQDTFVAEGHDLFFSFDDEEAMDDDERWSFDPVAVPAVPYFSPEED